MKLIIQIYSENKELKTICLFYSDLERVEFLYVVVC